MNPPKGRADVPEPSLEEAMARLEEIARRLETAELELAESLELYEEGVRLLRVCDAVLGRAEERVEQLRAEGEGFRLEGPGLAGTGTE